MYVASIKSQGYQRRTLKERGSSGDLHDMNKADDHSDQQHLSTTHICQTQTRR